MEQGTAAAPGKEHLEAVPEPLGSARAEPGLLQQGTIPSAASSGHTRLALGPSPPISVQKKPI